MFIVTGFYWKFHRFKTFFMLLISLVVVFQAKVVLTVCYIQMANWFVSEWHSQWSCEAASFVAHQHL